MFRKLLPTMSLFLLVLGSVSYFSQVFDTWHTSLQELPAFDTREWAVDETKQENKEETSSSATTCTPRRKFVFIKTHKTGSCTAGVIVRRYAIYHNLTVLYPAVASGPNMLAWPFQPAEEDYVHTPDEQYDAIVNHMRYNKTWLRAKFPADTAYFSVIREPSGHLKTSMNYYSLPKLMKINSKNPVKTFLEDPWKYKDLSEAYFDFCNMTWDGTRNHQSFDLGYPTKAADDMEQARRYIRELEADFTTMLLLEHLDESLVLLRRLMCWEVRDVLYDITPKNSRSYPYKTYVPTAEELANLRRWKAVDYLLYDTFNASLWRKIAAQGPDFYDELRHFKETKAQLKFVFIKTHKTGSCTAVNIFQRYAIKHRLSVLIPTGGNLLAWPFPPAEEDYVHTPDEQYDVLLNHMVYNKTWLRSKFPADTAYISIIREPIGHLRSAMNYYSLPKLLKIASSKNPVKTFLEDPWKYKDLSEAYFDFCNMTWDGTRNFLAFDLGYPTEGADDMEQGRQYISELEADFTLVLLLEHLDESLVLLRRLMCWEVRDVLYDIEAKNNRGYPYKSYSPTAKELANLRRWKAVDYLLYDTFNASLWRKIAAQGPDFYKELRYFKDVKRRVGEFCHGHGRKARKRDRRRSPLTIEASKWSRKFTVDSKYCRAIQEKEIPLGKYIRKRASVKDKKGRTIMRVAENVLRIVKGLATVKYKAEATKGKH
ncbi:PREDICTED: uncharacterized protein LOC109479017 [Branchiostoma belcheri]|uniref:Uncharacterized protein LOC109479017 n=1 Tax=Branchiostoma belcheri TaxID=7741 RepID=A0A6P4ZQS2_BRABE|nr:PREDICTED: uncharacterized protein LOC109479017 [Branchiostoma belcheri]